MFIIAIVVTKGTILSLVMEMPFTNPISEPRTSINKQARSQFIPESIIIAPEIPVNTVIPATDKSIPAPRITKVIPIATIPVTDAATRIFIRLIGEAYFPPDAIANITIKTTIAIKRVPFSKRVLLLENGGRGLLIDFLHPAIIS
jgi:hypothetical protein